MRFIFLYSKLAFCKGVLFGRINFSPPNNMLNVQAHASDLSVRAQAFSPMYEYHSPPAAPPPPPPPSAFAPRMPPLPDGAPHFEGWLKHAATVALANPLGSSGTALGTAVA